MRPFTLFELSKRIKDGASQVKEFSDFLDYFYGRQSKAEMSACLDDEPLQMADVRLDALFGACAEYLARRYQLSSLPKWAFHEQRYLKEPWFTTTGGDQLQEYLVFSSPAEFRSRNIFTEAAPFRRARTWQAEARFNFGNANASPAQN